MGLTGAGAKIRSAARLAGGGPDGYVRTESRAISARPIEREE